MDTLKNKKYLKYDYLSRYTSIPQYYDIISGRDISGIGENMLKNTPWVAHEVKQGDTLDSLSLKYYANPTYWWIIAYFNDIQDAFIKLQDRFVIIKIPAIRSVQFGLER